MNWITRRRLRMALLNITAADEFGDPKGDAHVDVPRNELTLEAAFFVASTRKYRTAALGLRREVIRFTDAARRQHWTPEATVIAVKESARRGCRTTEDREQDTISKAVSWTIERYFDEAGV